ncbi:haloalkane dehalogenase [Pseudotenacibaculum haliotis]|uniref:Haloalkane dehalogenase n=1 Tax=Pseudotenacibaculum haliotis TaxID=1862138 RepID=A0ABW5LPQ8_9FLAO
MDKSSDLFKYTTSYGLEVLRTPDSCFKDVDYPFKEHFAQVQEMRMHYVDENPNAKKVIVLLHGEPTWGYLYRKMIPILAKAGYRVIVPDLIGFGKSDKPLDKKSYSYSQNEEWLQEFLFDELNLNEINLVVHDWGGLIALRLVARFPEKFASVVATNTAFPRIEGFNPIFYIWRIIAFIISIVPYSKLIPLGINSAVKKDEMLAYDAPYPNAKYKIAPKIFPKLVPIYPWQKEVKKNKSLWKELCNFSKPFLTVFSGKDPFTKKVELDFIKEVKGAQGIAHKKVPKANHFIQEEEPELLSEYIVEFLENHVYLDR